MNYDDDIFRNVVGLGGGEPRWSEYTGTKALMVAVLECAIHDYYGADRRHCREAEHWMRSKSRGTFAFTVVCETLGLEPAAVRRTLERLKNQPVLPRRRIRSDVRKKRLTVGSA